MSFLGNVEHSITTAWTEEVSGNKKGPFGPNGFAIHLRKTGLKVLWLNGDTMSSVDFKSVNFKKGKSAAGTVG